MKIAEVGRALRRERRCSDPLAHDRQHPAQEGPRGGGLGVRRAFGGRRRPVEALGQAAATALADGRRAEPLRVYLQLSLDGDPARGGVDVGRPDLVDELCALADATDGLDFVGLMADPPVDADADESFTRLEAELHRVQAAYQQRLGLSAGMSGDLETAVRHGSTCVRVGTALMGQRPLTSP